MTLNLQIHNGQGEKLNICEESDGCNDCVPKCGRKCSKICDESDSCQDFGRNCFNACDDSCENFELPAVMNCCTSRFKNDCNDSCSEGPE